jgi:hypothetical protein
MTNQLIKPALSRLQKNKTQTDFWSVQLERAIEAYKHALSFDQRQASLGSRKVYYELDHFHRSISRKPRPKTIIRNWDRLHEAGRIFTEIVAACEVAALWTVARGSWSSIHGPAANL